MNTQTQVEQIHHKSNSHDLTLAQRICKALVINALSSLIKGKLDLQCPDGEWYHFGREETKASVIKIKNNRFWLRAVLFGDIGFAESYIEEEWDTNDLKSVISWFIINNEDSPLLEDSRKKAFWSNLLGKLNTLIHSLKLNSIKGSKVNIEKHYDLSNKLFSLFLDRTMTYSCAKFSSPSYSLEAAQIEKLKAICQKLKLKPQDRVLEIGSGWGSFAIYAASNYGCHVTTITISLQQYESVKRKIIELGLSDKIEITLQDYRETQGKFDKIVSVEMIEAVGEKYLNQFFSVLNRLLKPKGILVLQMITCPDSRYKILSKKVDFIQKHIFPGGLLPSLARITEATSKSGSLAIFEIEDMGTSYTKTLDAWHEKFNANQDEINKLGFDRIFIRKWNYYLQYCSAAFMTRNVSVVQAVLTRPNNTNLN